jgi:hypothetical protein
MSAGYEAYSTNSHDPKCECQIKLRSPMRHWRGRCCRGRAYARQGLTLLEFRQSWRHPADGHPRRISGLPVGLAIDRHDELLPSCAAIVSGMWSLRNCRAIIRTRARSPGRDRMSWSGRTATLTRLGFAGGGGGALLWGAPSITTIGPVAVATAALIGWQNTCSVAPVLGDAPSTMTASRAHTAPSTGTSLSPASSCVQCWPMPAKVGAKVAMNQSQGTAY